MMTVTIRLVSRDNNGIEDVLTITGNADVKTPAHLKKLWDMERAINSEGRLRCHVNLLPPDEPVE